MKTYMEFNEGFFSKKEKEDPDQKELEDLGMKAAGRGGWSKKEQEEKAAHTAKKVKKRTKGLVKKVKKSKKSKGK